MSKSPSPPGPEAVEDAEDDSNLKIRIPNPKMYIARQFSWVGRRGKPRCDYCRVNNLKCDRLLPTCNHCSWSNQQECVYTPLPTPTHRGIPRCDRCRKRTTKCDRNLPICNFCLEAGTSCMYTPKNKQKALTEGPEGSLEDNPRKWSNLPLDMKVKMGAYPWPKGYSVEGGGSSNQSEDSDQESNHTGRFTADFAHHRHTIASSSTRPPPPSVMHSRSYHVPPPSGPLKHDADYTAYGILVPSARVEPWSHPSFVSLPSIVTHRLRHIDPVEMPKRNDFEYSLDIFQRNIMPPLRETALFPPAKYGRLANCLASGNLSGLTERVAQWATIHRLCSGTGKLNLVLVPRDSVYYMDANTAYEDRQLFVSELLAGAPDVDRLQDRHYDLLPVQTQLYDILTYAHRTHLPAAQMLVEVVRLRIAFITWPMAEMYVRMCPLCNMRARNAIDRHNTPTSSSRSITP